MFYILTFYFLFRYTLYNHDESEYIQYNHLRMQAISFRRMWC